MPTYQGIWGSFPSYRMPMMNNAGPGRQVNLGTFQVWQICGRLLLKYLSFGFDLLINMWGKENTFWVELKACSLTVSHPGFLRPSVKCDFWICCSSIMSMSNVTLSCHFRIELRKNQAGEGNSYPSIYLRGGEQNYGNNKVASQRFLSFSLSALIQNIILYYCGRTRRCILRFGDSLRFSLQHNGQRIPVWSDCFASGPSPS